MKLIRKYRSLFVLAACIAAALVFKRFTFVAWYPVLMSFAAGSAFALSLFGKEPLCLTLAKKMPPHILPGGAEEYCRKYTVFWAVWLFANGLIAAATICMPGPVRHLESAGLDVPFVWVAWNCCLSYCMTAAIVFGEFIIRRRRFSVTFHTSGSTARPKTIVKTFAMLAREVAFHRAQFVRRGVFSPDQTPPVFLCTIEPHHMYGMLWRVLLPKAAGCRADPEVILTPESLLAKMRAAERIFLVTTPSFLERFCAYADQYDVPGNCVEIITSGALLTASTSAAAKRVFGIAPLEIFGSTETGGVASRRQGESDESSDWKVFDPVKVSVTGDGRLVVNSPFSFQRNFVMGDGAEPAPDGRSFKLLGRRDRLVKIAEQRVSLPEMEEKTAALPEVSEVALAQIDGVHGPALGAVVVLNRDVADVSQGKKKLALELRRKLLPVFPKGTVPRRYRFVSELPRNAQGKVLSAAVKMILKSDFTEPFVCEETRTETTWTACLVFDADASYFMGHFPGFAILPGVVQLGMAHHFAEMFLRRSFTLTSVKKMKFTRAIVPGERVRLTLSKKSENEMSYEYVKGEAPCSSGVLCF